MFYIIHNNKLNKKQRAFIDMISEEGETKELILKGREIYEEEEERVKDMKEDVLLFITPRPVLMQVAADENIHTCWLYWDAKKKIYEII